MEGVAVVITGLGFAAYVEMSGRPGDLAAGAAFGLAAAIGIGGLFAVHDQWELLARLYDMSSDLNQMSSDLTKQKQIITAADERQRRDAQLRSVNAFYLGYQLAITLSEWTEGQDSISFVMGLCQELTLPLRQDEWERLARQPTNSTEMKEIFDMVCSRVQQTAPAEWWCFFKLWLTVFELTQKLEEHQSVRSVRRGLEAICRDYNLTNDPRFLSAVDQLLDILPTTLALADADRANIVARVNTILDALPKGQPSSRIAPFPAPLTDWYWVRDGDIEGVAVAFIGSGHLTAYPGGRYNLEGVDDGEACVVRFENTDWHCSAHPNASGSQSCSHIELVYDLTDGGEPVTEARLLLVRYGEVEPEEALSQKPDSDMAEDLSDESNDGPD